MAADKVTASSVCQQPAMAAEECWRWPAVLRRWSAVPPVLYRWARLTVLLPPAAGLAAAAAAHTRAVPEPYWRAVGHLPGSRLPRGRRTHPRLPHGDCCSMSVGAAASGVHGVWLGVYAAGWQAATAAACVLGTVHDAGHLLWRPALMSATAPLGAGGV